MKHEMETAREILLARHSAVEPKLDVIRRTVIAGELKCQGRTPVSREEQRGDFVSWLPGCLTAPWRELILPSRRIWSGLAAVWSVLLVINFSQRDTVSSVTGQPVRSAPVMMSWQTQQRLMNEVLADRVTGPDVDRPKVVAPRPRTENVRLVVG